MLRPEKHIIAIAMRPTVINTMPRPCRGLGTSLYCIFSRMAPIATMASAQPIHQDALLHEQRSTHDSAVYGNQRQEDTQRCIERGRILLNSHLNQLHHTGNNGDEEDERQIAEVDPLNKAVGTQHLGLQQIVNRNGNGEHEGYSETESQRSLHGNSNDIACSISYFSL